MSSMRIAILGATGGCALSCLRQALEFSDVKSISVLVRTQSKLTSLLSERKLPPTLLEKLFVIEGDARNVDKVKETVQFADVVVSGVGQTMIPTGLWELWKPKWSDSTLCADTMKTLLTAVEQLPAAQRPRRLVVISTTGIEEKWNDVPLLFRPMYYYLLEVPHEDKRVMEKMIRERSVDVFPEVVTLRPSLLTDGSRTEGNVRIGVDVVGYTISREDTGVVTFNLCGKEGDEFVNKTVCASY